MLFDYLFWVLSHVHRRENKRWNILITCSALSILIFAYVFFIIHAAGFLRNENLFLKIENNFPNDELLMFVIFISLTLILNKIYSKRSDLVAQKLKHRLPTYRDYLKVLSCPIVPIIIIWLIR